MEERKEGEPASLAARTTEIVAAYVTENAGAIADLGHVIETVGRAVAALGREEAKPASAQPEPAVPVRRSIQKDHLVCLVCGKQQKNFDIISTPRTSSRQRRTASGSGSTPTTP